MVRRSRRWRQGSRRLAVLALLLSALTQVPAFASGASGTRAKQMTLSGDRTCDDGRPITISQPATSENSVLGATVTTSGDTIVLVAPRSGPTVTLFALRPNCGVDRGFGRDGRERLHTPGIIDAISQGAKGSVLLGGGIAKSPWVVGRLLPDGSPDPTFGTRGWVGLNLPDALHFRSDVNAPTVTSVEQLLSGNILVAGNNGNAHCCVLSSVAELTESGQVVASYGHQGWASGLFEGSYAASSFPASDGSTWLVGAVVYGGCGGNVLGQLTADGTFTAVRSTIGPSSRGQMLWSGSAYPRPNGGLGLVGDERSCYSTAKNVGLNGALLNNTDSDLSYGPSGYTRFPSDRAWWTWAVGVNDGGVVLVTEPPGPSYSMEFPRFLNLRLFAQNGSPDKEMGQRAVLRVNLRAASHNAEYPNIAAVAGPNNSVLLLIGSKHGIELLRFRT